LYKVRSEDSYRLLLDLRTLDFAQRTEPFGEYMHVTTDASVSAEYIAGVLTSRGHASVEVKPTHATVEDVFLDLIQ